MPESLRELFELLLAYAKQETVGPVRHLGRSVLFGVLGSLTLGIGLLLLVLAGLRVLQTETGSHFSGHLSWVPYACTLAATGLIAALAVVAATRRKARVRP